MDREIAPDRRRWVAARRGFGLLLVVVAAGVSLGAVRWLLQPSVERQRLTTARVERGPLEAVIEASGTVVPAYERVVTSPLETRVVRVLRRPGDVVAVGDTIVELDTSAAELELARKREELAQKHNDRANAEVELERKIARNRAEREVMALDLQIFESRVVRDQRLQAAGLLVDEKLHESEVDLRKCKVRLRQLGEAIEGERRATASLVAGYDSSIGILGREIADSESQLARAACRAERAGSVTWAFAQEGATVRRGETVARIADLDAFRVVATLSDLHAARIAGGQTVRIVVDDVVIDGRVESVDPTIDSGRLTFDIALDEPGHSALRNNLRVDALVVTDRRSDVLWIEKGPFARTGSTQQVFVVHGDRAVRTQVQLGMTGYRALEVIGGLVEGDEVIISDMSASLHVAELRLR